MNGGELTFDWLDDVLPAWLAGADTGPSVVLPTVVDRVGPLLELHLQQQAHPALPHLLSGFAHTAGVAAVRSLPRTASGSHADLGMGARPVEFRRPPTERNGASRDPGWVAFRKRLERGAVAAGFAADLAKGISAAARELVNNVLEHSGAAETAVVGYRVGAGVFEFVVGDRGVGALASLRRCARYRHLDDAGEALELAISPGVSGLQDAAPNRGYGFQTVFNALADLGGVVRVRSDDHILWLRGITLDHQEQQLAQSCQFTGFLVSVECRTRTGGISAEEVADDR